MIPVSHFRVWVDFVSQEFLEGNAGEGLRGAFVFVDSLVEDYLELLDFVVPHYFFLI